MSDYPWAVRLLFGGVVGAALGALGRFLVAASLLHYLRNWGSAYFSFPVRGVTHDDWGLVAISAGLGLIVGGISGSTCRPIWGAAVGGGLSGLFCLCLFVLPVNMLHSADSRPSAGDQAAISLGLLAMIFVGVIAGGIGAAAGQAAGQGRRIKAAQGAAADRPRD